MSSSTNTSSPRLWWDRSKRVNHVCSVCGYLLRDKEDYETGRKYDACTECVDTYYYPNAKAWEEGWRPKLEKENDFQ